jgi:acyl-coenzyme A thioesterase 13
MPTRIDDIDPEANPLASRPELSAAPPDGYELWPRSSPFLDLIGPLYMKVVDGTLSLGVRVDERHINRRGFAHGGFIATLADMILGYSLAFGRADAAPMVTTHLSLDFAGSAKLGDWVECLADVQKVGRSTGFVSTYLRVGERRIVRASGVFVVPQRD